MEEKITVLAIENRCQNELVVTGSNQNKPKVKISTLLIDLGNTKDKTKTIAPKNRKGSYIITSYLFYFIGYTLLSLSGNFGGRLTWVKDSSSKRAALPSSASACWVFSCFRNPPEL